MIHQLKIDEKWFCMKVNGLKRWEIRDNDRGFMVGDFLGLNETRAGEETGRFLLEEIVAIVRDAPGLHEGYVLLSTEVCRIETKVHGSELLYSMSSPPHGEQNRVKGDLLHENQEDC